MSKKTTTALAMRPPQDEVDEFAAKVKSDAERSLAFVKSIEIKTRAEFEFAGNALKEIAHSHDVIDAKRRSWVDGLAAVVADINATFKPATTALKEAESVLKERIGAFVLAAEAKRGALLQEASVAVAGGRSADAERVLAEADQLAVAPVEGVGVSVKWEGEVIDASAIPREYLTPDVDKLNKITAATEGDPQIPGWRAKRTAAVRTSRKG